MDTPKYEIWGNWHDDSAHGVADEFLEDVDTLEAARKAVKDYESPGVRYAYIRDKETQEMIP